jgi:hypothetical protein
VLAFKPRILYMLSRWSLPLSHTFSP